MTPSVIKNFTTAKIIGLHYFYRVETHFIDYSKHSKLSHLQRIFETTEGTLRFDGVDNFFTALVSGRTPSLRDASGAFFIDSGYNLFTVT